MFLDVLRRRNPRLIEQSIALHQGGRIPANSYVIDLDAVAANAGLLRAESDRHFRGVCADDTAAQNHDAPCRDARNAAQQHAAPAVDFL